MGLAAFNRMRREQAAKAKESSPEVEPKLDLPKQAKPAKKAAKAKE